MPQDPRPKLVTRWLSSTKASVCDAAPTFEFQLGAGNVIQGYGERGSKPDIPPNADLLAPP